MFSECCVCIAFFYIICYVCISVYSPFPDKVKFPLHNILSPKLLMNSIGAHFTT